MALGCMEHRGGCSADNDSGDGAGLLTNVPWELFKRDLPDLQEAHTGCVGEPRQLRSGTKPIAASRCAAPLLGPKRAHVSCCTRRAAESVLDAATSARCISPGLAWLQAHDESGCLLSVREGMQARFMHTCI